MHLLRQVAQLERSSQCATQRLAEFTQAAAAAAAELIESCATHLGGGFVATLSDSRVPVIKISRCSSCLGRKRQREIYLHNRFISECRMDEPSSQPPPPPSSESESSVAAGCGQTARRRILLFSGRQHFQLCCSPNSEAPIGGRDATRRVCEKKQHAHARAGQISCLRGSGVGAPISRVIWQTLPPQRRDQVRVRKENKNNTSSSQPCAPATNYLMSAAAVETKQRGSSFVYVTERAAPVQRRRWGPKCG